MNDDVFDGNVFVNDDSNDVIVEENMENIMEDPIDERDYSDEETSDEELYYSNFLDLSLSAGNSEPSLGGVNGKEDFGRSSEYYHNKAVIYAQLDMNNRAMMICKDGLKKFPLDIDLLACVIKYSSDSGDLQTATDYYSTLKENIPFQRWNWRAYTFSLDFLMKKDPIANEDECRMLINNYKKYLPYEEKACMAESELEEALGNMERSKEVLMEAICSHSNASQCALRLADMQMDQGLFDEVEKTSNYGIVASTRPQASISIPYVYYLRTLIKDHNLHKREYFGEAISKTEVEALMLEYEQLIEKFPELKKYESTIDTRYNMLYFVKTV